MDIFEKCAKFTTAHEIIATGFYPYFTPIYSAQDPEVIIDNKRMIMIGANDYLGLTTHPKLKRAATRAVKKYGTGCTGSRFLNGTFDIHVDLEEKLAKFENKESALFFSTGVLTNLGTIAGLVGRNDIVIIDRADHASIIDGCHLSFGETRRFKHNNMGDLERVLKACDTSKGKLIVVDGVFSTEGDLINLPDVVSLARKYKARVMVDDAHGVGVMGEGGRGTAEHFGLQDEVDIIMGTCSKALASMGGFITASEEVVHYLKHNSRALIFSASPPPASVAVVSAAIDIIQKEPQRRKRLWKNTEKMRSGFQDIGFNIGESQTPIIPVIIGDDMKTFQMRKMLFEKGVFTNPFVSPGVPEGHALLRTSYMATHTDEQLDYVLEVFESVGQKIGIIRGGRRRTSVKKPLHRRLSVRMKKGITAWMDRLYRFKQ